MMKFLPLVLIFLNSFVFAESRTWTSRKGTAIEAEFVEFKGKSVVLRRSEGGKQLTVPITSLVGKDQGYLQELRAEEGGAGGLGSNFDDPWPKRIELDDLPEVELVSEDAEKEIFIYHSPHYKYVCDVKLQPSLVKKFARLFEVSFQAMIELPMNLEKARKFDPVKRMRIELFESKEAYVANGGPASSAGVYMGSKNLVMVPLTSLGVRKFGSGYIIDRNISNKTLVHELVHQLTDHEYYVHGSNGWFTEGFAEYVANSPYSNSGKIKFTNNIPSIFEYYTGYSKKFGRGHNLGTDLKMANLKKYLLQSYPSFVANSSYNYGMGSILFTWFVHIDDKGSRKNFTAFLKAMKAGKKGEELLDVMKAGRTWEELENDISSGLRRYGIKLSFIETSY